MLQLPQSLNSGHVSALKSGWSAVVQTSFGLTVAFDWSSIASVSIPSTYMGAVCGLCGNFNGKAEDDLTLRRTNVSSTSPNEFGVSWRIADVPGCVNGCSGNCTNCDVSQRQSYESAEYCGVLRDPNGPFVECHALLDPAGFFEDCLADVCEFRGRRDILCQAISSYTSACQDAGARVYSWRTAQFCGRQNFWASFITILCKYRLKKTICVRRNLRLVLTTKATASYYFLLRSCYLLLLLIFEFFKSIYFCILISF